MCREADAVMRSGANGDGKTDDAPAFQAAVDALDDQSGRIVLPAVSGDQTGDR